MQGLPGSHDTAILILSSLAAHNAVCLVQQAAYTKLTLSCTPAKNVALQFADVELWQVKQNL